ncbi:MAG: hypothetical protein ACFFD4_26485 [Candidatus Odinarchaeota archaeon]
MVSQAIDLVVILYRLCIGTVLISLGFFIGHKIYQTNSQLWLNRFLGLSTIFYGTGFFFYSMFYFLVGLLASNAGNDLLLTTILKIYMTFVSLSIICGMISAIIINLGETRALNIVRSPLLGVLYVVPEGVVLGIIWLTDSITVFHEQHTFILGYLINFVVVPIAFLFLIIIALFYLQLYWKANRDHKEIASQIRTIVIGLFVLSGVFTIIPVQNFLGLTGRIGGIDLNGFLAPIIAITGFQLLNMGMSRDYSLGQLRVLMNLNKCQELLRSADPGLIKDSEPLLAEAEQLARHHRLTNTLVSILFWKTIISMQLQDFSAAEEYLSKAREIIISDKNEARSEELLTLEDQIADKKVIIKAERVYDYVTLLVSRTANEIRKVPFKIDSKEMRSYLEEMRRVFE